MSDRSREQALCYQIASTVLDYPGPDLVDALPMLRAAAGELPDAGRQPLRPLLDHLEGTPLLDLQSSYVETFDLRRRCCLYLTYYAYGDTRKRGMALLTFKAAYRAAGLVLDEGELPDHLCVVLEFAATADLEAGRRLLLDHRAGLELLGLSLREAGSPYAAAIRAVSATLPKLRGEDTDAVQKLINQGPPDEEVGLEPFAPPDYMGVGARR